MSACVVTCLAAIHSLRGTTKVQPVVSERIIRRGVKEKEENI